MSVEEKLIKRFINEVLDESEEGVGRPRSEPNTPFARQLDDMGGTKTLSDESGVSIPHLDRLARRVGYPSIKTLRKIAKATNQTMATVLGWFKDNKPAD